MNWIAATNGIVPDSVVSPKEALLNNTVEQAVEIVEKSTAILIGAGAGMGVDSGLPDFRGNEGFWRAYPPMKKLGLSFYDLANPVWFSQDPERAWGFYGHRRNLYRATVPHHGFEVLRKWIASKSGNGFVFTSNVDGHFQKSGFEPEQVVECHGAINFDQCVQPCCGEIWECDGTDVDVDLSLFRTVGTLPACIHCNEHARPNVLMFGDGTWNDARTGDQTKRYREWLSQNRGAKIAIIELGAGTAVPTVRYQCERISGQFDADLIRINPREAHGTDVLSVEMGALEALRSMDDLMS